MIFRFFVKEKRLNLELKEFNRVSLKEAFVIEIVLMIRSINAEHQSGSISLVWH